MASSSIRLRTALSPILPKPLDIAKACLKVGATSKAVARPSKAARMLSRRQTAISALQARSTNYVSDFHKPGGNDACPEHADDSLFLGLSHMKFVACINLTVEILCAVDCPNLVIDVSANVPFEMQTKHFPHAFASSLCGSRSDLTSSCFCGC